MAAPSEPGGTYVYGVVQASAKPADSSTGIEEQRVELVTSGELAAIVSAAPPGEVRGSRRNLMAHTHVLQDAVAEGCVLPMRFGVVMPSHAAVKGGLPGLHAERLPAQSDPFDGLV